MQNESNEELEKAEGARLKNALSDLWTALSICAVVTFIYFLIKVLKLDYRLGVIAADTPIVISRVLGSTIGILIIPFLVSLTFKNKARAFIIAWLIFMLLNLGVFIHDLNEMI